MIKQVQETKSQENNHKGDPGPWRDGNTDQRHVVVHAEEGLHPRGRGCGELPARVVMTAVPTMCGPFFWSARRRVPLGRG